MAVQTATPTIRDLLQSDPSQAVWWGTWTECQSALARLAREGTLSSSEQHQSRAALTTLRTGWTELRATDALRSRAARLVWSYPLRAADALQLAAAEEWRAVSSRSSAFVCLDARLRAVADAEGFDVLPLDLPVGAQ